MNMFSALTLASGSVIKNRIAKAAMEENLADAEHAPSADMMRLYTQWAEGGAGLIITGNVMIDRHAMTGPAGVVLENDQYLDRFKAWSKTAQQHGAHIWMQINHPGRQMPKNLGQPTLAPSEVAMDLGSFSKQFDTPKQMTEQEIRQVIARFIHTAVLAEQAGFDGVQIHAAHGYLISQFLSPITNQRNDQWGGSIENRARILTKVVNGVRQQVSGKFAISVKLNSADFQRGGFSPEDAQSVVQMLNGLQVDLVELSGGSYEAPAMHGRARDGRTLAREAYFLEFAKEISSVARMPLMVTGGIRRITVAQQVLDSNISMIGIATALAVNPSLPNEWQAQVENNNQIKPITWSNKVLASVAYMAVVRYQLQRLSRGQTTRPNAAAWQVLLCNQLEMSGKTRQYKRWIKQAQPAA